MTTTVSPHVDLPRLRLIFSSEALAWILERLRQRLQQGKGFKGVLILQNASAEQRDAADRLFGRSPRHGTSLAVRLQELETILQRAEICNTLEEAVFALLGPVANLSAARARAAERWQGLFDDERQEAQSDSRRLRWIANLESSGLLRRLSKGNLDIARRLFRDAQRVLNVLPLQGVPLAECAAQVLGDSHALDFGKPVATLILRAISDESNLNNDKIETRRDAWASVGIMLDELSCPVLLLNLRAESDSFTGRSMNLHAANGEPCRLTVRQLLRHPPRLNSQISGKIVYVCENPTVVAAAANRLGTHSAPLVCVEGQPRTAVRLLLNELNRAGIQLLYHGDFDWSGIQIANLVMERHGAASWRFDTESYLRFRGAKALIGRPISAIWDADLSPTMESVRRALDEEQVLDELLIDLATER